MNVGRTKDERRQNEDVVKSERKSPTPSSSPAGIGVITRITRMKHAIKTIREIRVIRGLYLGDFNTNYTNHTNVERVESVGIIHGQFMAIRDNKNFTIYCV